MSKNDQGVGAGTGAISILAIFVVLCLTTLATLSFVSARADHNLAIRTTQASLLFYEADAEAEERLAEIIPQLGAKDWEQEIEKLDCIVQTEGQYAQISYHVPIDEIKTLSVVIEAELNEERLPTGEWSRRIWQTQVAESMEPKEPMSVFIAD